MTSLDYKKFGFRSTNGGDVIEIGCIIKDKSEAFFQLFNDGSLNGILNLIYGIEFNIDLVSRESFLKKYFPCIRVDKFPSLRKRNRSIEERVTNNYVSDNSYEDYYISFVLVNYMMSSARQISYTFGYVMKSSVMTRVYSFEDSYDIEEYNTVTLYSDPSSTFIIVNETKLIQDKPKISLLRSFVSMYYEMFSCH